MFVGWSLHSLVWAHTELYSCAGAQGRLPVSARAVTSLCHIARRVATTVLVLHMPASIETAVNAKPHTPSKRHAAGESAKSMGSACSSMQIVTTPDLAKSAFMAAKPSC